MIHVFKIQKDPTNGQSLVQRTPWQQLSIWQFRVLRTGKMVLKGDPDSHVKQRRFVTNLPGFLVGQTSDFKPPRHWCQDLSFSDLPNDLETFPRRLKKVRRCHGETYWYKRFTFLGRKTLWSKGSMHQYQGNDLMEIPIEAPKQKKLWYSNNKYHRSQKRHISTKPDFTNGTCKNMFFVPTILGIKHFERGQKCSSSLKCLFKNHSPSCKNHWNEMKTENQILKRYNAIIPFFGWKSFFTWQICDGNKNPETF